MYKDVHCLTGFRRRKAYRQRVESRAAVIYAGLSFELSSAKCAAVGADERMSDCLNVKRGQYGVRNRYPFTGTSTRTSVPASGLLVMVSVPFNNFALISMPLMPKCSSLAASIAAVSKPVPSSKIMMRILSW